MSVEQSSRAAAPRRAPRPPNTRPGERPIKSGLFERLQSILKLGVGVFLLGFVVLVGIMVAMAFNLFSNPRVFELDVVGLPPDSFFVGVVDADGIKLLPHNVQVHRAGGKIDQAVDALNSKKSLVAPGAYSISLPLGVDPKAAAAIVVVRLDGRIERCAMEAIEGEGGKLRVNLSRGTWSEVGPDQFPELRRWASLRLQEAR